MYVAVCQEALGVENGDLPDQHFTSSSNGGPEKVPWKSRLNNDQAAWCAGENNSNQYLEVDLGRSQTVSRVASQGHPGRAFWVTSFGLAYSVDGIFWRNALDESKSMVRIFVTLSILNIPEALGNHTRRSKCVQSYMMGQRNFKVHKKLEYGILNLFSHFNFKQSHVYLLG